MRRHIGPLVPFAALLLALVVPASVSADHCGADATISPASGPPGTTFVFQTNLGAPSDLSLHRNGDFVGKFSLEGNGLVRYAIPTTSGDAGQWRARAEVRGQAECAAEASFVVIATPDTSSASVAPLASVLLVAAGLGLIAIGVALPLMARKPR